MSEIATKTLLEVHANELQAKYNLLQLGYSDLGKPIVQGTLRFHADYCGKEAQGEYDIRISIPDDYPISVPIAYEVGGAIARDFHRYASDLHLCLGAPAAVKMTFAESPTLLGFVEKLLVPHLFSHAYFVQHGEMPFGELDHGASGIITYYNEHFGTELLVTIKLLKILSDGSRRYKSYLSCPCQSNHHLGQCHGPHIEKLWSLMPSSYYANELKYILSYCEKTYTKSDIDFSRYLPYKILKKQTAKLKKKKPR
jgi:hypothetical protein